MYYIPIVDMNIPIAHTNALFDFTQVAPEGSSSIAPCVTMCMPNRSEETPFKVKAMIVCHLCEDTGLGLRRPSMVTTAFTDTTPL